MLFKLKINSYLKQMESKTVDYLFCDEEIRGQKYALISIVGPGMKAKADVWGLKIRGFSDTIDGAHELSRKIIACDPDFDIYVVEVGKFVPLDVKPGEIQDVRYLDQELNTLMKEYYKSQEKRKVIWENEKREKMKANLIKESNES